LKKLTISVSFFRKTDMAVVSVLVNPCVFAPLPIKPWAGDLAVKDDVADAL
jgi:hypothetical protein